MYRYCRAIDRAQYDDLRACYHPDATDHHGDFFGGVEEFVAYARSARPRYESSMHFVGNLNVEIDGDRARVESYVLAFCRFAPEQDKPTRDNVVALRYVDDVTRVDGEWRILHRKCVYEWTRTDPVGPGWALSEYFLRGQADRSDTVYQDSLAGRPDTPPSPSRREI
jgi:hypothetical protein